MFIVRSLAPQGVRYVDTFDRANGVIDNGWLVNGTSPNIVSNAAGFTTSSASQTLFGIVRWPAIMATDDHYSQMSFGSAVTAYNGTSILFLWVRANSALTQGVAMGLNGTGISIYAPTAYNSYGTAKATGTATGPSTNDVFQLKAQGNTYTVLQNGVQKAQWVDSTNIVPIGASNRNVCFGAQVTTSAFAGTGTALAADWQAQDLSFAA